VSEPSEWAEGRMAVLPDCEPNPREWWLCVPVDAEDFADEKGGILATFTTRERAESAAVHLALALDAARAEGRREGLREAAYFERIDPCRRGTEGEAS